MHTDVPAELLFLQSLLESEMGEGLRRLTECTTFSFCLSSQSVLENLCDDLTNVSLFQFSRGWGYICFVQHSTPPYGTDRGTSSCSVKVD
jgi:hypothetical protein